MSVYDKAGNVLENIYSKSGVSLATAYDKDGEIVFSEDPYIPGRTLVFEDDFNGTSLDSENWGYELGDVRSDELQTYRDTNNVSVENGCLVITAKKEDFGTKHWTSGSVTGMSKKTFQYGRFEAKIKFPNIVGAFGAFWMLGASRTYDYHETGPATGYGTPWPMCGEIDITETIPGNSTHAQSNLWKYSGGNFGEGYSGTITSSDWNIYACEWTSDYVAMSVNGTEYKRYTLSDYSSTETQAYFLPFYMILNLAVGKSGGTPAASTTEMKMYVDWVRVYAPLGGTS